MTGYNFASYQKQRESENYLKNIRRASAKYRQVHPEKVKEIAKLASRKYYETNKEKRKEKMREYYHRKLKENESTKNELN